MKSTQEILDALERNAVIVLANGDIIRKVPDGYESRQVIEQTETLQMQLTAVKPTLYELLCHITFRNADIEPTVIDAEPAIRYLT